MQLQQLAARIHVLHLAQRLEQLAVRWWKLLVAGGGRRSRTVVRNTQASGGESVGRGSTPSRRPSCPNPEAPDAGGGGGGGSHLRVSESVRDVRDDPRQVRVQALQRHVRR